MVLGVRVEPELERQLDQLALQLGKTRSACIREAISLYLSRHGDAAEARRQSEHLVQVEPTHWSDAGMGLKPAIRLDHHCWPWLSGVDTGAGHGYHRSTAENG